MLTVIGLPLFSSKKIVTAWLKRFVEYRFYPDSGLFDVEIPIDWTTDNEVYETIITSNYLTSRYGEIIFEPNHKKNDILKVNINPLEGSSFLSTVILFNNTDDFLIQEMKSINEVILDKKWKKAVIIISNSKSSIVLSGWTAIVRINSVFTVH